MNPSRRRHSFGAAVLALCLAPAPQENSRALTEESAQFLSQARYLISKEDRKELVAMPGEKQAEFIEQFWKRRDSDPATPQNEFKDEYFRRIELTNRMFTGEPQPGWLTDRGRIAILYGEPGRRDPPAPPAGKTRPCLETWHYDGFQVVFSDKDCNGVFALTTRDLDPIRNRNIALAALARSRREPRRLPFDVEIHILKTPIQGNRLESFVRLAMPYSQIWFDFKDGNLETAFTVEMELTDSRKAVRWTFKNVYPVTLSEAEFKVKQQEKFEITVPMAIEGGLDDLLIGKCLLTIIMGNETSKERIRKLAEFSF